MKKFPLLNIPLHQLKIIQTSNSEYKVWDRLRSKNISLSPEEYVRQNFINWLIIDKHYPPSLMANEISISLNGITKRCDSIVFDTSGHPVMIIEYKAPHIKITQDVFDQIVRYNLVLNADFIIVSNGLSHYCCNIDKNTRKIVFLRDIPSYSELTILIGKDE